MTGLELKKCLKGCSRDFTLYHIYGRQNCYFVILYTLTTLIDPIARKSSFSVFLGVIQIRLIVKKTFLPFLPCIRHII